MKGKEQIREAAEVYGYVEKKDYTIMLLTSEEDSIFRISCNDMNIAFTLYHSIQYRTMAQGAANLYIRSSAPTEKSDTDIEVIHKEKK